jgi:NADH-quinone oxidoreductase subunit M
MPVYSGIAFGLFFAGLGLPGLCGFIGEVFVTLSVWKYSHTLAVISAAVVILTAGYILWALQRVYLGPEYKGPHGDHIYPMTKREFAIAAPLLALAIFFGVFPNTLFKYMEPTITGNAQQLATWTRDVKDSKKVPNATVPAMITPRGNVQEENGVVLNDVKQIDRFIEEGNDIVPVTTKRNP